MCRAEKAGARWRTCAVPLFLMLAASRSQTIRKIASSSAVSGGSGIGAAEWRPPATQPRRRPL
jgi:hypothetical protein